MSWQVWSHVCITAVTFSTHKCWLRVTFLSAVNGHLCSGFSDEQEGVWTLDGRCLLCHDMKHQINVCHQHLLQLERVCVCVFGATWCRLLMLKWRANSAPWGWITLSLSPFFSPSLSLSLSAAAHLHREEKHDNLMLYVSGLLKAEEELACQFPPVWPIPSSSDMLELSNWFMQFVHTWWSDIN